MGSQRKGAEQGCQLVRKGPGLRDKHRRGDWERVIGEEGEPHGTCGEGMSCGSYTLALPSCVCMYICVHTICQWLQNPILLGLEALFKITFYTSVNL